MSTSGKSLLVLLYKPMLEVAGGKPIDWTKDSDLRGRLLFMTLRGVGGQNSPAKHDKCLCAIFASLLRTSGGVVAEGDNASAPTLPVRGGADSYSHLTLRVRLPSECLWVCHEDVLLF